MRALGLAHLTALDLPPPALIVAARRAGFDSVGLRVHPAVAGGAAYPAPVGSPAHRALADVLRGEGIRLNEIEFIQLTPEIDVASFAALLEAGAALGAASLTVSGDDADGARLVGNFAGLCDLAAGFGLRVDLEFMRWRAVGTLRQATDLVQRAGRPNGAVLIDALHLSRSGGTPADLAAVPGGLLRAAQLCDAGAAAPVGDAQTIAEAREGRLPPGQGALPLDALLAALPATANLSVEMPSREPDAVRRIDAAYRATRRLLDRREHAAEAARTRI